MENFIKTIISAIKSWTADKIKDSTADWNQNNPNATNYIKNRPFYTDDVIETTIVNEQTVTISENNDYALLDASIYLETGQTYTVYLNGEVYECIAWEYDDGHYLGNGDVCGCEGMGGNEPFSINSYNDGNIYLNVIDAGSYTISIIKIT